VLFPRVADAIEDQSVARAPSSLGYRPAAVLLDLNLVLRCDRAKVEPNFKRCPAVAKAVER
jgi:hypothetical protein